MISKITKYENDSKIVDIYIISILYIYIYIYIFINIKQFIDKLIFINFSQIKQSFH